VQNGGVPAEATTDDWMERWLPAMRSGGTDLSVLELGCDGGRDTAWLVEHGFTVVATDLAADALLACARVAPAAMRVRHDLRQRLPFQDRRFGAVVASLCLHYFDWRSTVAAVQEIRRCLVPGGLLLCRLNSVRDVLHGAGQGEEVEPGYYRQVARYATYKRFFDAADLDRLFDPEQWSAIHREERTVLRYAQPKLAWELLLRPA
jgi:SAM-dependent methyltransferase